jgi:hypothetical protein
VPFSSRKRAAKACCGGSQAIVSTYRDFDSGALYVTLRRADGDITLLVGGELADQIEALLIRRKRRRQQTVLTLVYGPTTFSVPSQSKHAKPTGHRARRQPPLLSNAYDLLPPYPQPYPAIGDTGAQKAYTRR